MPHMIEAHDRSFVVREPAWHRLADVVDDALNAPEAARQAGLTWLVYKEPIYDENGEVIPGWMRTVRGDTNATLGIVSPSYEVIQNGDMFRFFDNVFDRLEGRYYHTGGSLKNGRIVWLLAKVPGDFYLEGTDDHIRNYLLLASSHDGSISFTAQHTPIRVVCWNTLSLALKTAKNAIKIRHTKSANVQIQEASKALGFAQRNAEVLQDVATTLRRKPVRTKDLDKFLAIMFPHKRQDKPAPRQTIRKRRQVTYLFDQAETNTLPGIKHTAWALYNAVTEYVDHDWPSRKGTDRLHRSWFGSGAQMKRKAQRTLLEFAQTGEMA